MALIASSLAPGKAERALLRHRFLVRAAHAGAAAFLWVLLFNYFMLFGPAGHALIQTFLLYALAQAIALLLIPYASRLLSGGMRRGVIWGTIALVASLVYLGVLFGGFFPHGAALIGILMGIERAFYRVPYAVERSATLRSRSPHIAVEMALALLPVIIGALFAMQVPVWLIFFTLGLLAALALIPLFFIPNVYESFSWQYRETFARLAAPEHHALLSGSFRRGLSSAFLFLLWPIILFLGARSYLWLGGLFSTTLLVVLLFRSSDARVLFDTHADGGAYLDEYTALKEMGIALGQIAFALICAVALWFVAF